MPEQLTIDVGGQRYGGWKTVRTQLGIDRIAGGFELTASERWPGQASEFPLRVGDACTVRIDGDPVITGYIDTIERAHDARQHEITLRGRDRTGDLVDCSGPKRQWLAQKMERITTELTEPFGIPVRVDVDTGKRFPSMTSNAGEPVFEVIERMARMRGVLLMSDGLGGLIIGKRGTDRVRTALVLGQNVLSMRDTSSITDRFSKYTVVGQEWGGGPSGDDFNIDDYRRRGEAIDKAIKRFRPLVIVAEDTGDAAVFQLRANWEQSVRAGRSAQIVATVQGWRHADGLWEPNKLVPVRSEPLGVDADLLIVSVEFMLDDGGRRTQLTLTYPQAFDRIPLGVDKEAEWDLL